MLILTPSVTQKIYYVKNKDTRVLCTCGYVVWMIFFFKLALYLHDYISTS